MSNGCIGCQTKTKDQRFESALANATKYATEEKIPVAIYEEQGEWKYCNAFHAFANGYPVSQVVSINSGSSAQ